MSFAPEINGGRRPSSQPSVFLMNNTTHAICLVEVSDESKAIGIIKEKVHKLLVTIVKVVNNTTTVNDYDKI